MVLAGLDGYHCHIQLIGPMTDRAPLTIRLMLLDQILQFLFRHTI
jgi:hypothetical protein